MSDAMQLVSGAPLQMSLVNTPPSGSVDTDSIIDGSVTGPKIASGAVNGDKIASGSVSLDKITGYTLITAADVAAMF